MSNYDAGMLFVMGIALGVFIGYLLGCWRASREYR